MIKVITACVLFIAAETAFAACGGAQSMRPLDNVAAKSAKLLADREFAALDDMVKGYRQPESLAEDGQPNLIGMYKGLSKSQSICAGLHETDAVWAQQRALLTNWSKLSPSSTAPLLALASLELAQ